MNANHTLSEQRQFFVTSHNIRSYRHTFTGRKN